VCNCFSREKGLGRSIAFAFTLLACSSAFAVLGQDLSSVQSDGARIKAAISILPGRSYSIHQMRAPSGTSVKEFVSPAGEVFGVSWQGPSTPDLRQLLGEYFDQYMQAAQTTPRVFRRVVHVETGDLVVESGGHMRFKEGRAYLRSKLPDGVNIDDVR
jgi:uncharacterized protein DUF2844